MRYSYVLITLLSVASAQAQDTSPITNKGLIKLDYPFMSILYNCNNRGYEHFSYITQKDTGNYDRRSSFFQEERLPAKCRQFTTGTYKRIDKSGTQYDLGHGAGANHFDFSKAAIEQTNTMANVLPHASNLNRTGLWRQTDKIIECLRNDEPLLVYGGVVWGDDKSNDHFVNSHGVITPDYLYKIIIKNNGQYNAWLMPNDDVAKSKSGDSYLTSISHIEKLTGAVFPIDIQKDVIPKSTWKTPKGCDYK